MHWPIIFGKKAGTYVVFCHNCGASVPENSGFCQNCGAKIEVIPQVNVNQASQEPYYRPKKKLSKKTKVIIIVAIAVGVALLAGIKTIDVIKSIPTDKQIRMVANNLQNNSLAASDGKWFYFFGKGNDGLHRQKVSNGKKTKYIIQDRAAGEIFYLGGKLYLESLSEYSIIDSNGKTVMEIPNTTFTENKFQTDGKYCYFDCFGSDLDSGIYSQKLNGKKAKLLSEISVTKIMYNGDCLYLFSPFDIVGEKENRYKGVTRIDTNGKNEIKILDFMPSYFVFGDNCIYYTEDHRLYSMNFDGSGKKQVSNIEVGDGLNYYDGFIYYIDYKSDNICRISDGGNSYSTVLNQSKSDYITIVNGWIFYRNNDEHYSLYRMKLDGTSDQLVLE